MTAEPTTTRTEAADASDRADAEDRPRSRRGPAPETPERRWLRWLPRYTWSGTVGALVLRLRLADAVAAAPGLGHPGHHRRHHRGDRLRRRA